MINGNVEAIAINARLLGGKLFNEKKYQSNIAQSKFSNNKLYYYLNIIYNKYTKYKQNW